MLTYEQVELALHKWAHYFSNNNFEHWELINAVWEKGNVQKLKHERLASGRIKFDMIDYIRKTNNNRRKKLRIERGQIWPDTFVFSLFGDDCEFSSLQIEAKQEPTKFETDSFFEVLLKDFSRLDKLIIILRFWDNLTLAEVGKSLGFSQAWISERQANILKILRQKLEAA